jgi:hypothetical protein
VQYHYASFNLNKFKTITPMPSPKVELMGKGGSVRELCFTNIGFYLRHQAMLSKWGW